MHSEDFNDIVVVKVGEEKRTFHIHKNLLCKAAAYFRAALEGSFAEAQNQILELSEDHVDVFERFILWLYADRVLRTTETTDDVSWDLLINLYVFGETRGIADLQNAVIDILIDKKSYLDAIPTNWTNHLYDNTPENSPLRRWLVDITACHGKLTRDTWFNDKCTARFPDAFLYDLIFALYAKNNKGNSREKNFKASRSDYHVRSIEQE